MIKLLNQEEVNNLKDGTEVNILWVYISFTQKCGNNIDFIY